MTKIRPYSERDFPRINQMMIDAGMGELSAYAYNSGVALAYERDGIPVGAISAIYQGQKAYIDNLVIKGASPHIAHALISHMLTLLRVVGVRYVVFSAASVFAGLSRLAGAVEIQDATTLFFEL